MSAVRRAFAVDFDDSDWHRYNELQLHYRIEKKFRLRSFQISLQRMNHESIVTMRTNSLGTKIHTDMSSFASSKRKRKFPITDEVISWKMQL